MPDTEFPRSIAKASPQTVGLLTFEDGKQMTVEVAEFDGERSQLTAIVISPNLPGPNSGSEGRVIPFSQIVSIEPQPRAAQPWPFSDPCRARTFARTRLVLMGTMFLSTIIGGFLLFILLGGRPYGPQEASAIMYTMFEVFFTFAETRGLRAYLFTCPAVTPQIPRLLGRHAGFLVALFALQTAALAIRQRLPEWWNIENGKGLSPFEDALLILCFGLGFAQVFTNRLLLNRAHREFSA